MRSGDKETPPLCPSSCDGDTGGAGADRRTHGRGGYFQHGGLYAENGFEWNLNQVAIHVNTYGGIYPDEIKALQRDYADLWGPLSDLLKKLSAVVEL